MVPESACRDREMRRVKAAVVVAVVVADARRELELAKCAMATADEMADERSVADEAMSQSANRSIGFR